MPTELPGSTGIGYVICYLYKLMEGNIGEIQLGSKRELYKYINHYAVLIVIKASSKIILVQVYIIFALLIINRSSGLQYLVRS